MKYRIMHCYNKNSKLVAIIENNAISEMTWHNDGIYIYARVKTTFYGQISSDRSVAIKCDWTKMREVEAPVINYLREQGTPIYMTDDHLYEEAIECVYFGFNKEPELTEEDIEEGIRCSNL